MSSTSSTLSGEERFWITIVGIITLGVVSLIWGVIYYEISTHDPGVHKTWLPVRAVELSEEVVK